MATLMGYNARYANVSRVVHPVGQRFNDIVNLSLSGVTQLNRYVAYVSTDPPNLI